MIQIVLFEPEIPPNTGNIIRLCANTGAVLHLIHPLGFSPNDKQLKRAGLDYHEWARVHHHQSYLHFINEHKPQRVFACSTKGRRCYADVQYTMNDVFIFGPETRGLPKEIINQLPIEQVIRIPMLPDSRSLNLSNSVAVVLYEALRQIDFSVISLK